MRRTVLLLLTLLLLAPTPALARERVVLIRTEPADGAVLSAAPLRTQLWFSQALERGTVQVSLTDAAGRALISAAPETVTYQPGSVGFGDQFSSTFLFLCSIDPTRLPSTVIVELPELVAGTYRLSWAGRGLTDARDYAGSLVFQVQPGTQPVSADQVAAAGVSQPAADLLVTLSVRPNRPGVNFIQATIADTRRPAPAPVSRVLVHLTPPDSGAERVIVADALGAGRYQIPAQQLQPAGAWRVAVVTERAGWPAAFATFDWPIAPPVTQPPAAELPIWPLGLLSLAFAILGGITFWRTHQRRNDNPADDLEVSGA